MAKIDKVTETPTLEEMIAQADPRTPVTLTVTVPVSQARELAARFHDQPLDQVVADAVGHYIAAGPRQPGG